MPSVPASYQHPVARRIAEWVLANGTSLRELSKKAGLSHSTAQKACLQLDQGNGNVGLATLTALAQAMGKSLNWLLYGEERPGLRLCDLPEWESAAREAVERLGADPLTVAAVGKWLLHEPPRRLDAFLVAGLARAFSA